MLHLRLLMTTSIVVQLVVYDLPDRDCSAKASDGEFHLSDGGEAKYKEYIGAIKSQILKVPGVPIVIVLEPDSIGNRELPVVHH